MSQGIRVTSSHLWNNYIDWTRFSSLHVSHLYSTIFRQSCARARLIKRLATATIIYINMVCEQRLISRSTVAIRWLRMKNCAKRSLPYDTRIGWILSRNRLERIVIVIGRVYVRRGQPKGAFAQARLTRWRSLFQQQLPPEGRRETCNLAETTLDGFLTLTTRKFNLRRVPVERSRLIERACWRKSRVQSDRCHQWQYTRDIRVCLSISLFLFSAIERKMNGPERTVWNGKREWDKKEKEQRGTLRRLALDSNKPGHFRTWISKFLQFTRTNGAETQGTKSTLSTNCASTRLHTNW